MSEAEGVGKKKLTLSVDEDVVKRAKALNLNLSEITEQVLRGFAFAPGGDDNSTVYQKYKELFSIMLPLLKRYGTSVQVAYWLNEPEDDDPYSGGEVAVNLSADGKLWQYDSNDLTPEGDEIGREVEVTAISLSLLSKPKTILGNFIAAITKAKEERKEQLNELEMVKGIVAVIDKTLATGEQEKPRGRSKK
jgi:hypothetical protein